MQVGVNMMLFLGYWDQWPHLGHWFPRNLYANWAPWFLPTCWDPTRPVYFRHHDFYSINANRHSETPWFLPTYCDLVRLLPTHWDPSKLLLAFLEPVMCRVTCSITGHFTPATTGHSTPNKDTTPTAVGPLTPNSTVHLAWGTAAAADDHISHEGLAELLLIGGIEPKP